MGSALASLHVAACNKVLPQSNLETVKRFILSVV
jgi:hypothetical protein